MHFNKLRKALGFKQDSELSELVEKAGAFRIVRNRETNLLEAFISPLVGDRFTPTDNQVIEEPSIPYEIFDCTANALANDNDRDKISENQRQHKNGIDMHVLLAGNVPKFHVEANEEAVNRVVEIINHILDNKELHQFYFGECVYHICKKYNVDYNKACEVLNYYVRGKLAGHMSRRVGIENWPLDAILDWLRYYFGAKRLSQVITEVREEWNKQYANKF
jgi:hypothetical protein